jgi:hypothetical protein
MVFRRRGASTKWSRIIRTCCSANHKAKQGAGNRYTGACAAHVKFTGMLGLVCFLCVSTSGTLWASIEWAAVSIESPSASITSFAYRASHSVTPLPAAVIERVSEPDGVALDVDQADTLELAPSKLPDPRVGLPRVVSKDGVCGAVAAVARGYDLPVPFFANLIWQESNFRSNVISRAGAQGIAQFMPGTAAEFGLINPFEPIHALNAAAQFLRELHRRFGNLGLAAAAYNAGPRRVLDWMSRRGALPGETRNYVLKITGRSAALWADPEAAKDPDAALMPAKAPCDEVTEAVATQTRVVRVARLMIELATAAAPPPAPEADKPGGDETEVADADPDETTRAADRRKAPDREATSKPARKTGRRRGIGRRDSKVASSH